MALCDLLSMVLMCGYTPNSNATGKIQSPPCRTANDEQEDNGSNDSEGVFSTYVPWNSRTSSPTVPDERSEALEAYDPTSITVHMSILQELGTGQSCDEAYQPRGQVILS